MTSEDKQVVGGNVCLYKMDCFNISIKLKICLPKKKKNVDFLRWLSFFLLYLTPNNLCVYASFDKYRVYKTYRVRPGFDL